MNCWEFMKCGCEVGGVMEKEMGVCPAYPLHGKHCAFIAGTLCGGNVQGVFANKLKSCIECEFYRSEHYEKLQ